MSGIAIMPVRSNLRLLVARENLRRAEGGKPELKQSDIAEGSGVSQSVISTLLTGKSRRIDFDTIDRLCAYFRVDPGDLFVRERESS